MKSKYLTASLFKSVLHAVQISLTANPASAMDPAANVRALLKGLTEKIDILDTSLEALVKGSAAETAEKLPLLDRAKFYATYVYAIESILFCTI